MPRRKAAQHLLLVFLILTVLLSVRLLGEQTTRTESKRKESTLANAISTPATKKQAAANQSGDANLGSAIDRVLDESDVGQARFGVFVMSLKDGQVLYSRDANKLFTPASNMKVYTTAVALDLLGADYRWRTSV